MASEPRIKPAINQIEVHPFNTQEAIRATCAKHGIAMEAYAPLVRAKRMTHPTIKELADKYACSPAQVLVRYACFMSILKHFGGWWLRKKFFFC